MKRITTLIVLFIVISVTAQDYAFKQFYKSHKKQAEISLNVPSFLARMFIDNDDVDEEELLKKASNFKILVFNNDEGVRSDFKKFVKKGDFKTLVRVKDGNDRAEVYFVERGKYIREIVIMAGSKGDELVLLGLKTKLTKEELASIVNSTKDEIVSK